MKISLCLLTFALLGSMVRAGSAWTDDFGAAQARAKAENKKLLLAFTGSDWCGWCMKLEKEVFSKPQWKQYAAEHLVLVKVDFPQTKQLPSGVQKQNEKLAAKYHIEGFPTVLVLSPKGAKTGESGYVEGGPKAFIHALEKGGR